MIDGNMNQGRILLLEDEPIIGRVTSRTLQAEGFQVDIAVNGLIAKEKIAAEEYDLMIFDVRTPAMSGIQLYEYMEKASPHLISRVIFSTGDSLGGPTKTFLDRVKALYLSKPYTPTQLRAIVRQALGQTVTGA